MAKKKKIPAAVEAPRDFSTEANVENLKTLNSLLVKDTVKNREQIHQLRSKLASLAAEHDILDATHHDVFWAVLSSSLSDAAADSTAELAAATETVGKLLKKAELVTAKLNASEMRLLAVAREKNRIERDLERVVEERDLSRTDLDKKLKDIVNLEESIQSMEQILVHMLKGRETQDAKCGKLEEVLQSVMHEKDLLERCHEVDKHLAEKLVREMEVMKSKKDADMDILRAENKANASKISALEEKCRLLKKIRDQLENKVEEMKEEEEEFVQSYADIRKSYAKVEEDLKRNLTEFCCLEKEKLDLGKTSDFNQKKMAFQINDLNDNMTKMAAEKNSVDQRNADCEIQISNLHAEISELQSARKSLEDAHRSCIEKNYSLETFCAAVQAEKNLKDEEAATLRMQLNQSKLAKHGIKTNFELQSKLNNKRRNI